MTTATAPAPLRLYRGEDPSPGTPGTGFADPGRGPRDDRDDRGVPGEARPRVLPFARPAADRTPDGPARPSRRRFRLDAAHAPAPAGVGTEDASPSSALSSVLSEPGTAFGPAAPLPASLRVHGGQVPEETADDDPPAVAGRIGPVSRGWVAGLVAASTRAGCVPFPPPAGESPRVTKQDPVTRAKLLFAHRTCPCCGAGGTEPVLLADAALDAAGRPVPGTGTLVGFHCPRCEADWAV